MKRILVMILVLTIPNESTADVRVEPRPTPLDLVEPLLLVGCASIAFHNLSDAGSQTCSGVLLG